jgi:hypothetical protein
VAQGLVVPAPGRPHRVALEVAVVLVALAAVLAAPAAVDPRVVRQEDAAALRAAAVGDPRSGGRLAGGAATWRSSRHRS